MCDLSIEDCIQSIDFCKHLHIRICVLDIFGLIIVRPILLLGDSHGKLPCTIDGVNK